MRLALVLVAAFLLPAPFLHPAAPADLRIEGPATGTEGDRFAFAVADDPPPGTVVTYDWDFGDDTEGLSGPWQSAVSHRYGDDGEYTVTVRASGGAGGSASFDVVVSPEPPTVEVLSFEEPALPGEPVAFAAEATDPGDDDLVYEWDFGDGSPPVTGEDRTDVEHAFREPGRYAVTLRVRDEDDLEGVRRIVVEVNPGFLGALTGDVTSPVEAVSGKASLMNPLPGSRGLPIGGRPLFTGSAPMGVGVADLSEAYGVCFVVAGFWDDENEVHVNFFWTADADSLFVPKTYPVNWPGTEGDRIVPGQMMVNALRLEIEPTYEDTKKGAEEMEVFQPGVEGMLGNLRALMSMMMGGGARPVAPGRNYTLASRAGLVRIRKVTPERISGVMDVELRGAWMSGNPGGSGEASVRVDGSFAWELDEVARANLLRCGDREMGIETHAPWVEEENVDRKDTEISVTFTVPYDRETVNDRTFRVGVIPTGGGFRPLPGRLVHTADGRTVRFVPEEKLDPLAYHHVRLTGGEGGIRAEAGRPLPESYEWRFVAEPELTNSGTGEGRSALGPLRPRALPGLWGVGAAPEGSFGGGGWGASTFGFGRADGSGSAVQPYPDDPCDRDAGRGDLPSVDVVVYQSACDTKLIRGKDGFVRVYVGWDTEKEVVQAEGFEGQVIVRAGGATIGQTHGWIKNTLRATKEEKIRARNSINFPWTPPGGEGTVRVEAEVVPDKPIENVKRFPGTGDALGYMDRDLGLGLVSRTDQPVLEYVLVYARVGDWADGVPMSDRVAVDHRIQEAAEFARANLPVYEVRNVATVELDVPEPGPVKETTCEKNPCKVYELGAGQVASQFAKLEDLETEVETSHWIGGRVMEQLEGVTYAVIVLPPSHYTTERPGVTRPVGWSIRNMGSAAGVPLFRRSRTVIGAYVPQSTLAHEMAHYLGLPEGAHFGYENAQPGHVGVEGYLLWSQGRFNKSGIEGNGETGGGTYALMAYRDNSARNEEFIHRDNYRTLFAEVESHGFGPNDASLRAEPDRDDDVQPSPSPESAGRGPDAGQARVPPSRTQERGALRVQGVVDPAGGVILSLREASSGAPFEAGEDEGWAVVAYDGGGSEVGRAPVAVERAMNPDWSGARARAFDAVLPVTAAPARVALLGPGGGVADERARSGSEPRVRWVAPTEGAEWRPETELRWEGTDAHGDALRYTLLYSPDGAEPWIPLSAESDATAYRFGATPPVPGPRPTFRVVASDGFRRGESDLRLGVRVPPTPWATLPAPGTEVPTSTEVTAAFPVELQSVPEDALRLSGPDGAEVPGQVEWDPIGRTLRFRPETPLRPASRYTARLTPGLEDRWGNRLEGGHAWSFTTAADTVSPGVVVTWPRPGALAVARSAEVRVRFDESMDLASLEGGGLTVRTAGGGAVPGTLRWEEETREAVFAPAGELEASTAYRIVVSADATDLSGNPLRPEYGDSFTTVGELAPRRPPR